MSNPDETPAGVTGTDDRVPVLEQSPELKEAGPALNVPVLEKSPVLKESPIMEKVTPRMEKVSPKESPLVEISPDMEKHLPPPPPPAKDDSPLPRRLSAAPGEIPAARRGSAYSITNPKIRRGSAVSTEFTEKAAPLQPPRLKKKIPWKGKNIMVLLPWDEERGQPGKTPKPMRKSEVVTMMRDWDQLGYNTAGFDLGYDSRESSMIVGQSRPIWPDSETMQHERQTQRYNVSIPDRREWDNYVAELSKAKLRALGVSFDEDEPTPAPAPAPTAAVPAMPPAPMRQTSMQYPQLPFSPPLPTASAASSHLTQQGNMFSPAFLPGISTSQSSNVGSIASPALQAQIQAKYNGRQSMNGNGDALSPFPYSQQPSPAWSPQQMIFQNGLPRGGSPTVQALGTIASPSSPFPQDGYFPQQFAGQNSRKSPRLQEVFPANDYGHLPPGESPYQRGHNPSSSLQKEIDDAEYHLEEQFQRQLEHEDYSPHSETSNEKRLEVANENAKSYTPSGLRLGASTSEDPMPSAPELQHPQPHNRGHSLSQQPFDERDELTPSPINPLFQREDGQSFNNDPALPPNFEHISQHERNFSTISNPWQDVKPTGRLGHDSKSSLVKLNVTAKEFKFDPTSTFSPGQFSFGEPHQFGTAVPLQSSFTSNTPPVTGRPSNAFGSTPFTRKLSVDTPAFVPGQSDFSFSASGPSYHPSAPEFTPSNSLNSNSHSNKSAHDFNSSMFGPIDMSNAAFVKPPKKSKAITIVRPDSSSGTNFKDDGTVEGKDGRITQSDSRIKRTRGSAKDGDEIPQFAVPMIPLSETSREQSPPKDETASITTEADKENAHSETSTVQESPQQKLPRPRSFLDEAPDYDGSGWAPYDFENESSAAIFNDARPFMPPTRSLTFQPYVSSIHGDENAPKSAGFPPKQHAKGHKKNSLSATAKPFEFQPGPLASKISPPPASKTFSRPPTPGAAQSLPPATKPPVPILPPKEESDFAPKPTLGKGLAASKYAKSPSPQRRRMVTPDPESESGDEARGRSLLEPDSPPAYSEAEDNHTPKEPTFDEIDAVMRHLNEAEANLDIQQPESPQWHQPNPLRSIPNPMVLESSPVRLEPTLRSDAPSPSPRRFPFLPGEAASSQPAFAEEDSFASSSIRRLNRLDDTPASDWNDVISDDEGEKINRRSSFFDNHVNNLVGGLLAEKLNPLEKVLETMQQSILSLSKPAPRSSRFDRDISADLPESDADDEDDDEIFAHRSTSPRKDRKMEKIRTIVADALAAHQPIKPPYPTDNSILEKLEEMKGHIAQPARADFDHQALRTMIEEVVHSRIPVSSQPDIVSDKADELAARIYQLEERVERSDDKAEAEINARRAAEDRLAEVQLLLRISSEEEVRLREALIDREEQVKRAEDARNQSTLRTALLEGKYESTQKAMIDLSNQANELESYLRDARKAADRHHADASRAIESAKRRSEEVEHVNGLNRELRRTIEKLRLQTEESTRVREGMRGKFNDLQEDMAQAAREIAEENAKRAKREQELIARQDVLDAQLQAEARTRERLMFEIDRLEAGERQGLRAINDCKRLEVLVGELRLENDEAQKNVMRYKREFEEAKESGLAEVQRTKNYLQSEIEVANNQVNIVRDDLESQAMKLRMELDQVRLDADTVKAKDEMLLEEATKSSKKTLDDLIRKHEREIDDMQAQHERQLGSSVEDAQRAEQHLLERLSLSSAKTEHLQSRVSHLEEQLEVARAAANAAAQAARSTGTPSTFTRPALAAMAAPAVQQPTVAADPTPAPSALPEKISPQALRESIMVLQEQLQDREQNIEKLESQLAGVDLDAPNKILKRDDEITWLRELLAVRMSDLQDIITTLSQETFDAEAVKDAAIRLSASLQMEEQERERAMNGGSAINLPNIAERLKDVAASPRVAQAVGPLAAAWGNWRKGRELVPEIVTPSKPSGFLSGLMTPPSGVRQPTAFGNTGQRFTAEQLANRPRSQMRGSPALKGKGKQSEQAESPHTPPMMSQEDYDADAQEGGFSDAGFYDDDESTVDGGVLA